MQRKITPPRTREEMAGLPPMTPTHTEGPWGWVPSNQDLGATIKGPSGEYIADVQWRRNAPLLAAAPELLTMLVDILDECDWCFYREAEELPTDPRTCRDVNHADLADLINKALGR